jgi:hypothetical protein
MNDVVSLGLDGVFTWAKSFKDVQLKSEEQQRLSQVCVFICLLKGIDEDLI